MPDITMCTSENCPYRDKCYRARAEPSKYKSWSNFEYVCNEQAQMIVEDNSLYGSNKYKLLEELKIKIKDL